MNHCMRCDNETGDGSPYTPDGWGPFCLDCWGDLTPSERGDLASNPCPMPPVCEFGEYGCEAEVWWSEHIPGRHECCQRCGSAVGPCYSRYCQLRHGGVFGMCGHRPLTRLELRQLSTRGDRMGQRPEVDRVNVVPCDGTATVLMARSMTAPSS